MTSLLVDQRRLPAALAVCSAAWALGLALAGPGDVLLHLVPALLVFLPLLVGRYPGERTLARALERANKRWVRPATGAPLTSRVLHVAPRGGLLLATALAGRAPPRD